MTITDRYRAAAVTRTSINEHLPYFVDLTVALGAQRVLELGTAMSAWSTVAFLYGLEQTGGQLCSVDLLAAPFTAPAWTHIEGNDLDPHVIARTPDTVDILFIDTSHEYAHTLQELNVYGPKVRPGGRILLHDTASTRVISPFRARKRNEHERLSRDPFRISSEATRATYPVRFAADQYADAYGYRTEYRDECCGLGIIKIA